LKKEDDMGINDWLQIERGEQSRPTADELAQLGDPNIDGDDN
jgi:hypothetical protein